MTETSRRALVPATGLLLAAVVGAWVVAASTPPDPIPASAPADRFSAERASTELLDLARSPRPVGSAAHASAREYLLSALQGLGLEPQVQEARMVVRREVDRFVVVRVRNVLARLSGRDSTGAVALVAHYDSKPNTPGAGDAMAGVAAILETLRVLAAGPPLDNDLIVLFTDAEELGLVGARAFVERHPWAEDVRLVLNLEGRGSGGPAVMFETRAGNLDVIRGLRRAVPDASASSLSYEVYRRMPNDTDFSVFRQAGVQGFNVAFLANHPAYHTMLDRPESLALGTLQHHGSYAVGFVRHFGSVDLSSLQDVSGGDAVYFNPYPGRLIGYPASWALPLALATSVVFLGAAALAWRHRRLTPSGVGRGLVLFGAVVVTAGGVGWLFWWLVRNVVAGMLFAPHGLAYGAGWLVVSLVVLIVGTLGLLGAWLGGEGRSLELWAGVWLGWAMLGIGLAIWLPGASYLATWPLLAGAVGLLVLVLPALARVTERGEPLIMVIAALPAVLLLAPTVWTVAQALTLGAAGAIGGAAGLMLTGLVPPLVTLHRSTGGKSSALMVVIGFGLLAWRAIGAEPSAITPSINTLAYAIDAESGEGWWASLDDETDAWTSIFLGESPARDLAPDAFGLGDTRALFAAADPVVLPPPTAETVSDSRARGRRVEAVARSTRGASVVRIRAEASVPFVAVSIEDERFDFAGDPEAEGLGEVRIMAFGCGPEGVRFGFELAEPWPIELEVTDMSWGFGALPEPPAARPPSAMPSSSWYTDAVYVRGSSLL